MSVVTISASYGAGGSRIGPRVAQALGLPFVDRAIPLAVAQRLGVPLSAAEAADGKSEGGMWWVLSTIAMVPDLSGTAALGYGQAPDAGLFREHTEAVLREIADGSGGVILGRAGAIVLADAADALHVRLDGPEEARIAAVLRLRDLVDDGVDDDARREEIRRELRDSDTARTGYVRHFYRCDPVDPCHYHLLCDSTALPWDTVVEIIVAAARARGIGG